MSASMVRTITWRKPDNLAVPGENNPSCAHGAISRFAHLGKCLSPSKRDRDGLPAQENPNVLAAGQGSCSGKRRCWGKADPLALGSNVCEFTPASSGSCSVELVTRDSMFFQCSPVSGSKRGLGRQKASSRAPGNSFGADKFSDGLAIVIVHH